MRPAKPVGGMVVGVGVGARLEVAADAEGAIAGAGDHGDAQRRIGREKIERGGDLAMRVRIERVDARAGD